MIELIRTYQGYTRPEGKIKQTFTYMYRCSKCESITNTLKEIRQEGCTHEFKTTPTAGTKNKV
jgi:rRNA maturation endonuclease Nob1